ncbi:MAG: zinc-ribbon domain-containing protein [Promethearchaeota archaeon]
MSIKDLKILKEKELRLFLILTIWLLFAFTFFQFREFFPEWLPYIIYLPLLGLCLSLIFAAFLFKKNLKELGPKQILIYFAITVPIILIFAFIALILFVFAILTYVFITSIFTCYNCYKKGVKFDDNWYTKPFPINAAVRWTVFIGGTVLAILFIAIVAIVGAGFALFSEDVKSMLGFVPIAMFLVILILALIGGLMVLIGRLNAWLGIFFLWVSFYTLFLMIKAFLAVGGDSDGGSSIIYVQIALYLFDLFLILSTMGSLVGKRAELISEKIHIRPENILIWLIFAKAAYEFADAVPGMEASQFKAIWVFVLFIPLVFIMGIYGIKSYGKLKKERKRRKKRSKIEKTSEKKKKKIEKTLKREGLSKEEIEKRLSKVGIFCTKCGADNVKTAKECRKCGAKLYYKEEKEKMKLITEKLEKKDEKEPFEEGEELVFCQKCGKKNLKGANFCRSCGEKIFYA